MKTTIVIPTYNEAVNLPILVEKLFNLPLTDLSILVVDDNSPDGTGNIAEELGKKYDGRVSVLHRAGKLGLGSAYIQGFQKAIQNGAEAVGQMDADFSHPPEKVVELVKALETCDMALGSRYVTGGKLDERWPLWRKALSGFGNFYARTILGLKLRDVTGGFRLWKSSTLNAMPLDRIRSNGYIFQVEMVYVATKLGFHFSEIPIYFADRRWGQSKMSIRIQLEAAVRVWQLPGMYRDL
ncbi:polyprenol monophosphomannose synthase [Leptolinea tardivitalis]|uniref:Glycosyl transferase n=1 Tax=Leptolinea tardivitalis TaxID=229920 RepID=A0A0P6XQG4_9CHLR|nr:polyprenol monophosphomannose synthase [Leptolinea tardivitalis]KPL71683.1 glycosyl transferase [Leptolinea tardivitalis]GAP20028.1 glycosyltransferase [Leptolinea tardivitalis]